VADSTLEKHPDRSEPLQALLEISKAITSDLYLEDILKLIVTVTAGAMRSPICSLMLLDDKGKELVVRASQSVSEAYNKKPNLPIGHGIAGRVVKEKHPIVVRDVRTDPRYANPELARKEGLCSLLSVPLMVKGSVIGALNCYASEPHDFTQEEIDLLTTVANQAAVAIENTQLIVRTKVIQEELEARKLVERAKDILMRVHGFDGEDAYRRMRQQSMNTRRSMREIAEAIILADEMSR